MNKYSLPEKIKSNFQFSFTKEQEKIVREVSGFVTSISTRNIFLLKGYAGTGKTSLISSLVNSLSYVGKKSSLLAPTGRAAKVLSKYSKKSASTIHRKIYWINSNKSGNTYIRSFLSAYYFSKDGKFNFDLLKNIKQFPDQKLFEPLLRHSSEIVRQVFVRLTLKNIKCSDAFRPFVTKSRIKEAMPRIARLLDFL